MLDAFYVEANHIHTAKSLMVSTYYQSFMKPAASLRCFQDLVSTANPQIDCSPKSDATFFNVHFNIIRLFLVR
jgi:hypothetical protein